MSFITDTPLKIPDATPHFMPETHKVSPDYVRLSGASALALRFTSGRFTRNFKFGGINMLLSYDEGCLSDCAYCGLARSRSGNYKDKSFIRVEWPLLETNEVINRMAKYEDKLTRLCISMITHGRAYEDTVEIARRIAEKINTPLSLLVAPPTLNQARLVVLKELGVDMIGIGLDAVTEEVFAATRTDVPNGGLHWNNYLDIVNDSREIYGPWKVNCHVVLGLGETDWDMIDIIYYLFDREIYAYLFSFNPEPDSRMTDQPKSSICRWRRIQLVKYLIEKHGFERRHIVFNTAGEMVRLNVPKSQVESVVESSLAFMTHGCPGEQGEPGEPGCTRPYGSYRPSEPYRDYPFLPDRNDRAEIKRQLSLEEFVR